MTFNKSQQTAIRHKDGPMLVLAGPGSGKTAVITQRTYNLIHREGVDPANILVITFTRAAAEEMRSRFEALNGGRSAVTFGTFHSVFFMVLKIAYHFTSANIITQEQRYQIMRELVAKYRLEYQDEGELIAGLFGEISNIKNSRIPLDHFYSTQCGEEVFRKLYQDYERRLRENKLIDFDDMLTFTYELFDQRKDILSAWQRKYQYILIDEFQDINLLQYDIVRMMALPANNLFIVGDDDQSIYRFRGSRPEIMLGFTRDYPDAKQILLDTNYRCGRYIVETAGNLISYNEERFVKQIIAARDAAEPVRYLNFENRRDENLHVLREIVQLLRQGVPSSEIAVLFRTNTQPRLLSELLLEQNVDFKVKDQMPNIYDHWIVKDLFAYIRIARGSNAREDFLQIMNRPKRYLSRDSLEKPEVSFKEWKHFYRQQDWMVERLNDLEMQLRMLKLMKPYAAINYIRKGIGYEEYLEDYAEYRGIEKAELMEVLDEVHASSKGFQSFEEWQEHIRVYTAKMKAMNQQRSEKSNAVTLATLHSSKGLEFQYVFIIDANDGIMPYKKAILAKDIEEERRLFYVGMTRAKDVLTICSVKSIHDRNTAVSRFIGESKRGQKGTVQKSEHLWKK